MAFTHERRVARDRTRGYIGEDGRPHRGRPASVASRPPRPATPLRMTFVSLLLTSLLFAAPLLVAVVPLLLSLSEIDDDRTPPSHGDDRPGLPPPPPRPTGGDSAVHNVDAVEVDAFVPADLDRSRAVSNGGSARVATESCATGSS